MIKLKKNSKLPVALFNGTVVTTNGLYFIDDIEIETAKKHINNNGFISAIGHAATAEIMSEILGYNIPMNRINFHQQVGQVAIVFKLNERPNEGTILNIEEVKNIGYNLKIMRRLRWIS